MSWCIKLAWNSWEVSFQVGIQVSQSVSQSVSQGHIACMHACMHACMGPLTKSLPCWCGTKPWQRAATWHACDHGVQLLPATWKHLHSCMKTPGYLITNDTVVHMASNPQVRVRREVWEIPPPASNWSQGHTHWPNKWCQNFWWPSTVSPHYPYGLVAESSAESHGSSTR